MSTQNTLRIAIRKFGPFESAIRKQFASFKVATRCPLELDYESLELNALYESLFTRRGLLDGTWDIVFLVTDWLAEAVAEGALTDLRPYMRAAPLPDYPQGWPSSLIAFQEIGEAVYGTPYHDGPECFIYRKDLFEDVREQRAFQERFGYPLAPPQTWAQFYDIARFFTRPEHNLYGTIFAAYPDGHNTVYDFCLHLWSRGGELLDSAGRPSLDTPQAARALDFYRQIVLDPTATHPKAQEIDSVRSGALFSEGRVAMMVNWFGFAAACELPNCPVKGKVAVAPLPAEEGRSVSLSVYWILALAAGSGHKEEAYAFLRHVCTPEMDKGTTTEGAIGCRLSTWADPAVNASIPYYHQLAILNQGARTLPRSREFPRLAHVIDTAVQRALSCADSTESILQQAQSEAERLRL
ncbi:MAG TPA: extracellular solute-binding protein [Chthonomonadales bacterium]|nr:extracellular solute-binding protein [Chthonomonadales bacterium]